MKNILARGGIEFLAVLFGITISLWVEDWRENKDIQIKIVEDYTNIKQEVEIDIENIENIILSIEEQIKSLTKLIQYNEKKIIYWILGLTIVFFTVCLSIPVLWDSNLVGDTNFEQSPPKIEGGHH